MELESLSCNKDMAALNAGAPQAPTDHQATAAVRRVILDHDGGADDIVALALLCAAPFADLPESYPSVAAAAVTEGGASSPAAAADTQRLSELRGRCHAVALIGVVVTDADCYAAPAREASEKVLKLFEPLRRSVSARQGSAAPAVPPVRVASFKGTAEPFPDEWRKDCIAIGDLPCLNTFDDAAAAPGGDDDGFDEGMTGEELMARLVLDAPAPVTIVVTGPLSSVAWCIRTHGRAWCDKVDEVVVMGGAVDVKGNVIATNLPKKVPTAADAGGGVPSVDESAEWNIYWDAPAAKAVLTCPFLDGKLVLFTLDATNHVPVSQPFVRSFGKIHRKRGREEAAAASALFPRHPSSLAQLFGSAWAQVTFLALQFGETRGYFAWDVLTAAYVLEPRVCTFYQCTLDVNATRGSPSEGRTFRVDDKSGPLCRVAKDVDNGAFYDLVRLVAAVV